MTQDEITEMQARIPMAGAPLSERARLRRRARWLELEAMRGYVGVVDEYGMNSSDRSKMYAANQRWLVELMDAGVKVAGVRFDYLVATKARMTWNDFMRRHAERICGERYKSGRKR